MTDADFTEIKPLLDSQLDSLPSDTPVGIKLGFNLYTEFRSRGLLEPREVDMILWKWMQASYRGKFVVDGFDIGDNEFRVGSA